MRLDPLYHWSPKRNRASILQHGLQVLSPEQTRALPFCAGYLCFSMWPSCAWGLSAAMREDGEDEEWDCWQVWLADTDEVRVMPLHGARVQEVRVHNSIPPDRLWWVGERTYYTHETLPPPKRRRR